jgi:hypothetical protein
LLHSVFFNPPQLSRHWHGLAAFTGISIALLFGKGYESADDWAALFEAGIVEKQLED